MPCNADSPVAIRAAVSLVLGGLLMLSAPALHAETWLLRGTIGSYPVVLELNTYDDRMDGTYFYERYRQDIPLRGESTEEGYRLSSPRYDDDKDKADYFVLSRNGDSFSGSFRHGKGRMLPVELTLVAPGNVPELRPDIPFERPLSDYERLRLANIRLVPGKEETTGNGYRIRWVSEPLSGVSMFHVVDGYPKAAMVRINRIIDRDFYTNVSQHFSCPDGNGGSGDEGTGVTSLYLNERLVSYAVSSSWGCYGSAHPDFGTRGTTIDATTGRELALEDVYRPGSDGRPVPDPGESSRYRNDVFAPAVAELFQGLYPARMKDGDCDYSDPSVWAFPAWYMTDNGLYLGAYFARAARACDSPDWSVVPYKVLERNNPALF